MAGVKRRWWQARAQRQTYSVIGLATDDGSTFCPAVTMYGNVRGQLAGEDRPYAGSVLYVVDDAPSPDAATQQALEHFEANAVAAIWERGEVHFI